MVGTRYATEGTSGLQFVFLPTERLTIQTQIVPAGGRKARRPQQRMRLGNPGCPDAKPGSPARQASVSVPVVSAALTPLGRRSAMGCNAAG